LLYKNISNVHIRGKFKKIMRIQKSSDGLRPVDR